MGARREILNFFATLDLYFLYNILKVLEEARHVPAYDARPLIFIHQHQIPL